MYFDNKKVIKSTLNETEKESKCMQETSAIVETMKRKIKKVTIDIEIEHSNDKPRKNKTFQQEPGPFLVKECDEKSKEVRGQLTDEDEETLHIGGTTPVCNGVLKDKVVETLIREIDAKIMS